jgi:hypothetical protein
MFLFFPGASLKFALQLIQVTRVQESMALIQEKNLSQVAPEILFELTLALNVCNLAQTMNEEFVKKEVDPEDREDIADDYVVQNLRFQNWITIRDGAERMERCQKILNIAEKLGENWAKKDEPGGPGPRFYCVKDVLRRLGNEKNLVLQNELLNFVNLYHKHFQHFFKVLLEPFQAAPIIEEPKKVEPLPLSETQKKTTPLPVFEVPSKIEPSPELPPPITNDVPHF